VTNPTGPNPQMFDDDPFGKVKVEPRANVPSARDVNKFHTNSDVDVSTTAHHHTIGVQRNQSASGLHNHTGTDSRKVGAGSGITVTGSRGGNAALQSLITQLQKVIDITNSTTP
jgi:hypothetical protein